jgi:DNA-binding response OmpR family regulator
VPDHRTPSGCRRHRRPRPAGVRLQTFVARSAERALGILSQWRFDAALVDADGFGAGYVDVLRELRPQFRSPVILLSTSQSEAQQILSLECGATEVVIKPASPRLLAAKMQRLIEVVHDTDRAAQENACSSGRCRCTLAAASHASTTLRST